MRQSSHQPFEPIVGQAFSAESWTSNLTTLPPKDGRESQPMPRFERSCLSVGSVPRNLKTLLPSDGREFFGRRDRASQRQENLGVGLGRSGKPWDVLGRCGPLWDAPGMHWDVLPACSLEPRASR